MKLKIILALVLVTTLCSAHSLLKRETETDVEETNGEEGTAASAVEAREQPIEMGQPMAHPKEMFPEEDKRGMDVPFMSMPDVCTGWVEDFYDEYLVLSEDRNAVFSDLQRFFIFMDDDGDGKISAEEFNPKWMEASGFGELDSSALFYTFFTTIGDPEDEAHIVPRNVERIWEDLFMTDIDGGELTKEDFGATWQNIVLPALPQHGCSGGNVQASDGDDADMTKEDAQIRPDVYGYYKKKK